MSKRPLLTIGMATHTDFHGTYFTIQAIRTLHPEILHRIEFVVVDNAPDNAHGEALRGLIANVRGGGDKIQYVPYVEAVGTSASREKIFEVASGTFVMSVDCHVLFTKGSLMKLIRYLDRHTITSDFMHGPLYYDNLINSATHFNAQWRSEMWGTWGAAWVDSKGKQFSTIQQNGVMVPVDLRDGESPISIAGDPGTVRWEGHENILKAQGCRSLMDTGLTFEIPGQGLGMFVVAKDHWPGFNPHARGFGGEELYIHRKHQEQGKKVVLLPFLGWVHRFARPDGIKYPITLWNKVRNYVLEFQEMGWDTKPIYDHFVRDLNKLSQEQWEHLEANAIESTVYPGDMTPPAGGVNLGDDWIHQKSTMEGIYSHLKTIPRDFDQHMDKLREVADGCERVFESSGRRESAVALLASKAKTVISRNDESGNSVIQKSLLMMKDRDASCKAAVDLKDVGKCDLVFLDGPDTHLELTKKLKQLVSLEIPTRYIAIHDTAIYPELLVAIRDFMTAFREWSVIYSTTDQYGFTIMSCLKEDKPKLPPLTQEAKNFWGSALDYIRSGFEHVPKEEYEQRLATCMVCPSRNDTRCSECGCVIAAKAKAKVQACPLGKWNVVFDEETEQDVLQDGTSEDEEAGHASPAEEGASRSDTDQE